MVIVLQNKYSKYCFSFYLVIYLLFKVIEPDGTVREFTRGDSFGVRSTKDDRTHRGNMRTVTEDCHFACVPQADYLEIMSREGEAEIPEMGEGGRVVLVYESIDLTSQNTTGKIVNNDLEKTLILPKKSQLVTKVCFNFSYYIY